MLLAGVHLAELKRRRKRMRRGLIGGRRQGGEVVETMTVKRRKGMRKKTTKRETAKGHRVQTRVLSTDTRVGQVVGEERWEGEREGRA
jgi:hypothetical protein